ncbi:MAG: neutral/alkaline non-lysosomal ceramidase N-terminal domain-containing protein [Armatimonadota bacterium]
MVLNAFGPLVLFYVVAGVSMLGLRPTPAMALQAGVARVDITPPVDERSIPLNGYGERQRKPAEGVHDRISATALVLANEQGKVAIVATDLLWVTIDFTRKVLEHVESPGLGLENIFLSGSHNHSGPAALDRRVVYQQAFGEFDAELFEETARKVAQAIDDACAGLRPARAGVASRPLPGLTRNRRDGEEITDPTMTVIEVADEKGDIAVLVNFAAHPTILGPENLLVSGDYPGALQRSLEQRLGNGAAVLFTNGAEGDQTCVIGDNGAPFEAMKHYGDALAAAAHDMMGEIVLSDQVELAWTVLDWTLPDPRVPERWRAFVDDSFMKLIFPTSAPVGAIRVGDAVLVTVPGEMVAEIGLTVKSAARQMGARHAAIISLVNDYLGYILTPEQYNDGGYEPAFSFYGQSFGQAIQEGACRALAAVCNGQPVLP